MNELKTFIIGDSFCSNYISLNCFMEEKYKYQKINIDFVLFLGNYIIDMINTSEQLEHHIDLYNSERLIPGQNNIFLDETILNSLYDNYMFYNYQFNIKDYIISNKKVLTKEKRKKYYFI